MLFIVLAAAEFGMRYYRASQEPVDDISEVNPHQHQSFGGDMGDVDPSLYELPNELVPELSSHKIDFLYCIG